MKRNQNFDYNRSQKVLSCRYNMDINRVEARFEDDFTIGQSRIHTLEKFRSR